MVARLMKHIAIFAAGVIAALAFLGVYWQSNKDELSQKILAKVVEDDLCPDTASDSSVDAVESVDEDKIYFVGCGGFF